MKNTKTTITINKVNDKFFEVIIKGFAKDKQMKLLGFTKLTKEIWKTQITEAKELYPFHDYLFFLKVKFIFENMKKSEIYDFLEEYLLEIKDRDTVYIAPGPDEYFGYMIDELDEFEMNFWRRQLEPYRNLDDIKLDDFEESQIESLDPDMPEEYKNMIIDKRCSEMKRFYLIQMYEMGIPFEVVKEVVHPDLSANQTMYVCDGFKNELSVEQIKDYSDPAYSEEFMNLMYCAHSYNLSVEQIRLLKNRAVDIYNNRILQLLLESMVECVPEKSIYKMIKIIKSDESLTKKLNAISDIKYTESKFDMDSHSKSRSYLKSHQTER